MNPSYWLLIALVSMAVVCFFVALIAYQIGYDQGHLDAEPDRHTHRKGDPLPPLPRSGILLPPESTADPFSPFDWRFAGGWDEGPSGSAEYELLTRTAELPSLCAACGSASCPGVAGGVDACPLWQEAEERRDRGEFLPTFPLPADPVGTTTDEIRAITAKVETWIAEWEAQGNYDRHVIQAGE
jgi:hypothetical protein